jgi:hypothetical protein
MTLAFRRAVSLLALALTPSLAACADEDDVADPSPTPVTRSCRVSISPTRFTYTIAGNVMTVRDENGASDTLNRTSASTQGRLPILGTWLADETQVGPPVGGTIKTSLRFEPNRVSVVGTCVSGSSSVSVTASSEATIDDTSVSILSSDSDERTY